MKPIDKFRYVAYDAANGDYEEFKTLKEAEDWLTENVVSYLLNYRKI